MNKPVKRAMRTLKNKRKRHEEKKSYQKRQKVRFVVVKTQFFR
jgi:hypothetical protein